MKKILVLLCLLFLFGCGVDEPMCGVDINCTASGEVIDPPCVEECPVYYPDVFTNYTHCKVGDDIHPICFPY